MAASEVFRRAASLRNVSFHRGGGLVLMKRTTNFAEALGFGNDADELIRTVRILVPWRD